MTNNLEDQDDFRNYWTPFFKREAFISRMHAFATIVMVVVVVGLTWQIQTLKGALNRAEDSSVRAEKASFETRIAAEATKKILEDAIRAVNSPSAQAQYARDQIKNIELMLSEITGRSVVTPPPSTTTTTIPSNTGS